MNDYKVNVTNRRNVSEVREYYMGDWTASDISQWMYDVSQSAKNNSGIEKNITVYRDESGLYVNHTEMVREPQIF